MKNLLKNQKLIPIITTGILLLIVPYLLYTGCTKGSDETSSVTLSVSATSMNFRAAGEQKNFTVTSNAPWTVSKDASWLTVSPSDNSVTVEAAANTTISQREASVKISSRVKGVPEQSIVMTQDGLTPELTVSTTLLSFEKAGEQKQFTISSNISWTMSSSASSWLTVNPSSGNNNGTINVTASANSSASRSATITVGGSGITRTVSAFQAGTTQAYEPEMILVPGGTFKMGCTGEQGSDCHTDENPSHQVTLNSFSIGKYEVTEGQWKAVMGSNPSVDIRGDKYPENYIYPGI